MDALTDAQMIALSMDEPQVFAHVFDRHFDAVTRYAGVQSVQFHAMCAWAAYWLDGHRAGDGSQMALALVAIEEFPRWQSVSDPRLADDSIRQEVASVVAGARSGDAAPVELMYTGMMCDWALSR